MKKIKIITALSLLILPVCATYNPVPDDPSDPSRYVIWINSDIQYQTFAQMNNFPDAVDDIAENIGRIDMAITAGDIVEKERAPHIYDWYLKTREKVNTGAWFEIAGNHENRDIELYRQKIRKDLNYAVSAGNMIIIFMSTIYRGDISPIPDDVITWWKDIVINNQDKIIITVTHIALKQSGLIHGRLDIDTFYIENSVEFEKVLKKYRVDIWFSGHTHLPDYAPRTEYKNNDLNGTVFIDTGSIRKESYKDVESRILVFRRGSRDFIIKYRNHTKKTYSGDKIFTLPYEFRMGVDEKPVIFSTKKSSFKFIEKKSR